MFIFLKDHNKYKYYQRILNFFPTNLTAFLFLFQNTQSWEISQFRKCLSLLSLLFLWDTSLYYVENFFFFRFVLFVINSSLSFLGLIFESTFFDLQEMFIFWLLSELSKLFLFPDYFWLIFLVSFFFSSTTFFDSISFFCFFFFFISFWFKALLSSPERSESESERS